MHSASPERGDSISIFFCVMLTSMVFLVELFVLLANTFSASSLGTGGCYSSSLLLKFVRFCDGCHRPVAADDVRKMLLLVEVPLVWRGDGCVWVAELVLICLVVVLVVAVAVAADGVVVPDPWEFIS
jgi:hypothetical protein